MKTITMLRRLKTIVRHLKTTSWMFPQNVERSQMSRVLQYNFVSFKKQYLRCVPTIEGHKFIDEVANRHKHVILIVCSQYALENHFIAVLVECNYSSLFFQNNTMAVDWFFVAVNVLKEFKFKTAMTTISAN